MGFFEQLLSDDFLPHGYCIAWQPALLWLHFISDGLIALAYYSISLALAYFVGSRKDMVYSWMFKLFGLFIFACGTTHLMAVITLWEPVYWLDGGIKAATASVSVLTAVMLWPLLPQALALPSPTQLEKSKEAMQKQMTERQEAEEKFRGLLEAAPDAMTAINRQGQIVFANAQIEQIFGYRQAEIIDQPVEILLPERFRSQHLKHRVNYLVKPSVRPMGAGFELFGRRKDGSEFPVEISLSPLDTKEGLLIISAIRDITDRKQAEDKIKASLKEKEVLLQEIHHRVKNNLQVISSLLNLQAGYIADKTTLKIFADSQHRVRSMALVHESLYQSQDLALIDFAKYTHQLTRYLFHAYGVKASDVILKINIDKVFLEIDTAIPCGLIINELISNALEHAFSPETGKTGQIYIDLQINYQQIFLTVGDNGVGFPAEIDFRQTESLGLQLVNILVMDELEGTIELERRNGTLFKIIFARSMGRQGQELRG